MFDVNPEALDALAERLIRAGTAVSAGSLAAEFGWTPARLAAMVEALRGLGAPIEESGNSWMLRLDDPLDATVIRRALLAKDGPIAVVVRRVCASTNELARALPPPAVCVAEAQTAGRGRRGARWIAPFGGGLALSLAAPLPRGRLDPLAIALALAAVQCLDATGYAGIRLKWPNDLYARGAKLGGLMAEVEGGTGGRLCIGFGLNVLAAPRVSGRETIALAALGSPPSRNRLAAALAMAFLAALNRYDAEGFTPFAAAFPGFDVLAGQAVDLRGEGGTIQGVVRGIDASGALLLDTDDGRRACRAGEVSLVSPTEASWAGV